MNRLADETSPYLRQHWDNPVDWYPWGDEAFEAAARLDRPLLVSVGYSSCHWCHVMAHESFEDPHTAAIMNRLFVNVKVDREERPDVDAVYMDSVQAMTGRGGWPMTVFCTPDGRPFYGGTYYPNRPHHQMPSFQQVMAAIDDAWTNRKADVHAQADQLTALIGRASKLMDTAEAHAAGEPVLHPGLLDTAANAIVAGFDADWGGFGGAPKFPAAMTLAAALRLHHGQRSSTGSGNGPDADNGTIGNAGADSANDSATRNYQLLQVVRTSLDAMASGGIYDHLGGGFARYSVDRQWLVPHFEKMLYDNALLTRVHTHAWQITGEPTYRQVLDETIGYVLRDLCHPDGGFYSAEDADSEGVEGKFYVWSEAELRAVVTQKVGPDAADEAVRWWGVTPEGNFEGANILNRPIRGDLLRPESVEAARVALLEHRGLRIRPGLDDKVLTEWNALMLAALAEAAAATGNTDWRRAAEANGEFLVANLRRPTDGRWLRSWQAGGEGRPAGARHLTYAADYAALVDAFTRLAELTGQKRWITEACACADGLLELFTDPESAGFYTTGNDAEELVFRPKDVMDNATPSAQSLAAVGLSRLGAITGNARYQDRAGQIIESLAETAAGHPTAFGLMLEAVEGALTGPTEVVVAGDRPDLVQEVHARYLPNVVLAWGEPHDSPLWEGREDGYAYVCRQYTCRLPVNTPEDLAAQLDG